MRVLLINGGPLDYGGISSYMMNYLTHIDPKVVHFDFVVHGEERGPREAEALAYGARVYHVPHRRGSFLKNLFALKRIFETGDYAIVHAHLDGMNGYVLLLAKWAGIPVRLAHCHNTQHLTTNPLRRLMHRITSWVTPRVATRLFACSNAAATFFYGDRLVRAGRVTVVQNAIDLERFRFDEAARKRIREELGLTDDCFVLGQVGRLEYQKNHAFMLEAFSAFHERRPNTALVLLGDGVLRPAIEAQIQELGLEHAVHLLGYCEDTAAYYNAFDAFVLPSRFEGLGIVLIEAQMAGLPCLVSNAVPQDAQVMHCRALPLETGDWAEAMEQLYYEPRLRRSDPSPLRAAGFDIRMEAGKLQRIYEELNP